ncbi:hypothetical protein RSK20926_08232 [Roseobacter sp. SK209-2-6]|uniref:hypothetical protein n=1 Tax=Roseobacter sp. SK209-2-6 TaxID=388739 RepID=UPI0000F3D232|nr:hypothetical protein [Roseobacter sp. SK209-2-6]EBA16942.1 hypothetical protein RSK20926_08232 [Roseobacter sp. SK209-2-6]
MTEVEYRRKDLPSPDDRQAVLAFAKQFNAYRYHGSLSAAFDAAEASRRETVLELRTELFIAYRTANHQGAGGLEEVYRGLLPCFEKLALD